MSNISGAFIKGSIHCNKPLSIGSMIYKVTYITFQICNDIFMGLFSTSFLSPVFNSVINNSHIDKQNNIKKFLTHI